MKKQIIISLLVCIASAATAQNLQPVNIIKTKLSLVKTVTNKTSSSTSFGDMDINNNTHTTTVIDINLNPVNKDSASIETTFKKLKMTSEAMEQKMEFDSENPLTSSSAAAEGLSGIVGSSLKFYINNNGFVTSIDSTHKVGVSPKLNMIQFGGLSLGTDCSMFLNITKPVKVGDVWKDSSMANNTKIVNEYKFKSYEKGLAIVEQNSTIVMDGEIEQMGMKMKTNQQGTIKAVLTINPKSLLIVNKKADSVFEGTFTASGQSIPLKVTTNTVESVE